MRGIFDKETEVCLLLFLGIMMEYSLGGRGMRRVIYSEAKRGRLEFDQRQEIVYSRAEQMVFACQQSSDSYIIILQNVKEGTTTRTS